MPDQATTTNPNSGATILTRTLNQYTLTHSIAIEVKPCAITQGSIAGITAAFPNTGTTTNLASYTNAESSTTHCGAINYSLIGTAAGVSYDSATRTVTYTPPDKTAVTHTL
jgi:hypothetical protein